MMNSSEALTKRVIANTSSITAGKALSCSSVLGQRSGCAVEGGWAPG
jgi:hypothetical protein